MHSLTADSSPMKRIFIFLLSTVLPLSLWGQLQDDFSDGDFTNNPSWIGQGSDFIVNAANELQLDATGPSPRYLCLPANTNSSNTTTWEFYYRCDFAPSGNNNGRIYLSSSTPDLTSSNLQGYFVQMGGESGTTDALELYRQDGNSETLLFRGQDGAMGNAPALARVRVTRTATGTWELLADYSGGTTFVSEGSANDATYPQGGFFGLWCKFTSSNADNFFLDDVSINPVAVDNTPPQLLNATPQSATTLLLEFDELLDASSATTASNYSLSGGIGIASAQLQGTQNVLLNLSSSLVNGSSYTLTINGVEDFVGNALNNGTQTFNYFQIISPSTDDLLISEIMADPTPVVGLPEGEYLELYNTTPFNIDLNGVRLTHQSIGGSTVSDLVLPSYLLAPSASVFIYDNGSTGFAGSPNSIEVGSLFGITNGGATLRIENAQGDLVSSIRYTDDWYQDEDKADGGWSLEMINPDLYCKGASNWRASTNSTGGTPGQSNSVTDNTPDNTPPSLLSISQVDTNRILLRFDDVLDSLTAGIPSNYQLNGSAVFTTAILLDAQSVLLTSSTAFTDQVTYSLLVENVEDCVGNTLLSQSLDFTYFETQAAERYDIIINEIYADPNPLVALPDAEFVELYNRSDKVIDLQDYRFEDASSTAATLPSYLLQPGDYLILTDVDNNFDFSSFGPSLLLQSFPSLNVSGDELQLINNNGSLIDAVAYTTDWYQDSNKDDGGWTLERINPNSPCLGRDNWRAANNLIGGTPGAANSVLDTFPDTRGPDALRAFPLAADTVRLFFNEALAEDAITDLSNYTLSGGLSVTFAELEAPLFSTVRIGLSDSMQIGTTYFLKLESGYTDCIDNTIGLFDSLRLALPELAEEGDVVLNELLFNPVSGGGDYLELYNRSNKVLNAGNWIIANMNDIGLPDATENITTDWLLFPGDYLLLSEMPFQVAEQYQSPAGRQFLDNNLPSMPDDEGGILLFSGLAGVGGTLLDQVRYSEDWQVPFIDDLNGVALERIDPSAASQDADNWHSAPSALRFGTPGYQNSSFRPLTGIEATIELPSRTLSPDGDGFEDFLQIQYQLDDLGYVANLQIYDAQGRLVRTLLQSELLAQEGQIIWDGSDDRGERVRIGPYLLLLEIFNAEGEVERIKEHCVVAEMF